MSQPRTTDLGRSAFHNEELGSDFTAFVTSEEVEADLGKILRKRGVKPQEVEDITPEADRLRLARRTARHRWIDFLRSKDHRNPVVDPMDAWQHRSRLGRDFRHPHWCHDGHAGLDQP